MAILLNNKNINFRRFYLAQAISSFGDWVSYVAIPLIIYNATKDPISIAIYTLCKFIPNMIVTPYIGKLIKKYNSVKIMAFSDFIRGIVFLGYLLTDNTIWIYIITFIISMFSAVFNPIKFNVVPKIVCEKELTNANSHIAGISKLMMLIGPSIGGVLMTIFEKEFVIIVNSLSFFVSLYFILKIGHLKNTNNTEYDYVNKKNINHKYINVFFKLLNNKRNVVNFILLSSLVNCTFGTLNTLFPIVASNFVNSSAMYGYIMSILGLGLLLGTSITPKLLKNRNYIQLYSYVTILGSIFLALFGLSKNHILTLLMVLGFSIGNGIQEVSSVSYIQIIGKEDSLELFTISQTISSSLVLVSTSFSAISAKFLGIDLTIINLSVLTLILGSIILVCNKYLMKREI